MSGSNHVWVCQPNWEFTRHVSNQPFYTGLTHGPSSRVMVNGYKLFICNVNVNDESYASDGQTSSETRQCLIQSSSVSLWSRETSTWRNSCTRRSSSVDRHAVRHYTRHTLEEEFRTATAHQGTQSSRRRTTQCSGSMDSRRWSSWMVLCWLRDLMMMMMMMDQQSGIHYQIICGIQLLTLNIFGGTWNVHRRLQSVGALGVFTLALYKSTFTYLLTYYLLTYLFFYWNKWNEPINQ